MTIEEALKKLNSHFVYQKDDLRWFDHWRILYSEKEQKWVGDCEDYALTLMWMLSGRNLFQFLWDILRLKYLMWFVKYPNGAGHAIVRIENLYYDNIQKKGVTKEELVSTGYKFVFPMIPPFVFIKLLLSYIIGIFFRK
jgi:predicted transglutaminase-like cysteine proteinase